MSELTPEQEDDLRFLAVADTVPLHMRQRLLAVLAEIDRLQQRVDDLTAGLRPFVDYARRIDALAYPGPDTEELVGRYDSAALGRDSDIRAPRLGQCRAAARLLAEDQK